MNTYREIKMEFDGVQFNTYVNDIEFEILQKDAESMNEYLEEEGCAPDWTIQKSISTAIFRGVMVFKEAQERKQEIKAAADEGTPDSQKEYFRPPV